LPTCITLGPNICITLRGVTWLALRIDAWCALRQAHYECKVLFIFPVPKKNCSIPMSTSDFSYLYRWKKDLCIRHKTFFKIIREIRCRHQYGNNSIGNLKTNEIDLLNFILQIIFNGIQKITIFIDPFNIKKEHYSLNCTCPFG
jgi:hypothetical protein